MRMSGRLRARALLIGGPIYVVYVLTVIFQPFGLGG